MTDKQKQFTGIRDWKLRDICEGDILLTQQGTKFVVSWSSKFNEWVIIQSNENNLPGLQGQEFELKRYMQPNLEIIGSIYKNANEIF